MTLPDQQSDNPQFQRLVDHLNAFGLPVKMIDHDPTDADFGVDARDGYLAVNYSSSTLFVRVLGSWKGTALT